VLLQDVGPGSFNRPTRDSDLGSGATIAVGLGLVMAEGWPAWKVATRFFNQGFGRSLGRILRLIGGRFGFS
jgi:hypothetical protein